MTGLDVFALIILLVLALTVIGVWVALGMMPGKIARERNHPQADAISVAGWWGVITMGVLLPIAFIWAYTKTTREEQPEEAASATESDAQHPTE